MFSSNTTQVSDGGYQISRSLRFNSADSAYLNRTPASAGNRTTWTWSGWVKRSSLGAYNFLFNAVSGNSETEIIFTNNDTLQFLVYNSGATAGSLNTTQVFRDVSAWYHIIVAYDSTNATSGERMRIYVNGSRVTAFSGETYPAQNTQGLINSTISHTLGTYTPTQFFFNGYITEVNFIDGQALTPSSFGETNAQTGAWQPKAYSGSYGTNGFYLNFSDNSNTTAATLGADYSGNGNNWTPNNFSVTAGAGNDSLVDSPTSYGVDTGVGGTVRGNYATLNPLQISTTYATISNGNLQYVDTTVSGSYRSAYSTIFATSGKFYFEATGTSISGVPAPSIGLVSPPPQNDTYIEQTLTGYQGYGYNADGTKATNDTYTAYGSSYTAGDTVAVAVDIDAGKVWFAKNGTWQASGDPAAGTNPAFNIVTGRAYGFAVGNGSSTASIQMDANFGQRAFAYTAPSGFKALNTQNLPTPTIGATTATQAGKFFNPVLWTGNGSNPRAVTGVGFQPDFSWLARRDVGYGFWLYDAVRGATKTISSQSTAVESTYQQLNSFDTDGFTQAGTVDQGNNISGGSYVAWNWKANGSGSSNTAGSITSTVSVNTTSGFSIATWTGSGSGAVTIGHGLGVSPSMIIVKDRTQARNWNVYHVSVGNASGLKLNNTDGVFVSSGWWNNTTPTASVFTVGTFANEASTYVAYCFAEIAGYSKFGSYTGNGSSTGPFIYTGFRPRFVMIKIASGPTYNTDNWFMFDTARGLYNDNNPYLLANTSSAEGAFTAPEMLSNGFCVNTTSNALNYNGSTYIYMAFAEAPLKFSLAR